jgi:hypothetical protein
MTRMLSDIFGAEEHLLQQGLQKLERASGHDSADVRLTAEVLQSSKRKLMELGLDPNDTTGPELYGTLKQRLREDDARLGAKLRELSGSGDTVEAVAHALKTADIDRTCFVLKQPVLKSVLKKNSPKQTMKQLGYRSLDSMLKHEPVCTLLAAAALLESPTWRKAFHDSYKKLKATDFETRQLAVLTPDSERWQKLADTLVGARKHTVVALKEVGAIVLLPQPKDVPEATITTTLILALHSLNEIRAAGTFLKLSQMKTDFGTHVQEVVADEPQLATELLDQQVPWHIVQRYYTRFKEAFRSEVFEPYIQSDDLHWHSVEQILESLEPSLGYWKDTQHVALLHDRQAVSFNIADVALAVCNSLPYEQRIVHYLRHSLQAELLLKYLKHDSVEQVVMNQMDGELATEPVLI